jgi:ABC-type multidrug transport system fused ATPase/permease subunit
MAVLLSASKLILPEIIRLSIKSIEKQNVNMLMNYIVFALTLSVVNIAIIVLNALVVRRTKNIYEQSIQRRLIDKMEKIKLISLKKINVGDIITEMVNNPMDGVNNSMDCLCSWITGFSTILISIIYMCLLEWRLALCILSYNIILRLGSIFVERKLKKNSQEVIEVTKNNNNLIMNFITNNIIIRLYKKDNYFNDILKKNEHNALKANLKRNAWGNGLMDITWATAKFAEFVIIYGLGGLFVNRETTSIGTLLSFVFASDIFVNGIDSFASALFAKNRALAIIESINKFFGINETENECDVLNDQTFPPIYFRNVSFGYPGRPVLENVNLTINRGDRILLKGPNGEGKSTLLLLLSGLYRPQKGQIVFGNKETSGVNLENLIKIISIVPQSNYILDGSIKENIALNTVFSEVKIQEALHDINLKNITDISPQLLSQGEKKRINIGRAFYKDKVPILLGDEIFANLDKGNIEFIINNLKEYFDNGTFIFVCHDAIDFNFNRALTVNNKTITEEKPN